MKRVVVTVLIVLLMALTLVIGWIAGRVGIGSVVEPESLTDLERAFVTRMKGASLTGRFTVAGRQDVMEPDSYQIASVEKVGDDLWRFNARIGEGAVIPVVVPMRWIGDTPVIMMTDHSIPSLGTFSTRVLFYGDRYAGTWQHGDAGGHLFGRIETP
jgi:hypothetical protein